MIIATSFTIFATYTRRMFPCLMTGSLMLKCTPLRYLIVGLRQLHIPQKLIVAISVTLRYFPAREGDGIPSVCDLYAAAGIRKQFAGSRVSAGWAHIGPAIGVELP